MITKCIRLGATILTLALLGLASAKAQPKLEVSLVAGPSVRLAWQDSFNTFVLENTSALGTNAVWERFGSNPASEGTARVVVVPITGQARFYRLRTGAGVTQVIETSPSAGEGGVAVTRETIFRFSGPLAADALLTVSNLFAEFGARRMLSRVELSGDRRAATLFYLENLPASARIRVRLDGRGVKDVAGNDLDSDGNGQSGGVRELEFETAGITGLPNTAVIGHVYVSEKGSGGQNRPLENATVTVDGAEETLRTVTDASGFFRLQPAPSGRFFVHVDGRTAVGSQWPGGAYYPFVGKAWEAVPGRTNNLANGTGEIFLPLIRADALQAVSATEATPIRFSPSVIAENPALAGVEVRVPADALFSENGARGGKVGIAAVPPDRLPEPLPPGLNLPLVITIQTDGPMNFNRPMPVRFPNLPDPVTGEKLGPGAKTALWSFNHDTGRWEIQGPATVTADGNFVEGDPGVGVRQPGWHGVGVGSSGGPGPNGHDDDGDDDDDDEDDDDDDDDDDNDVDPCKKQRQLMESAATECDLSYDGFGFVIKAAPFVGCGVSIGQGVAGSVGDCNIDFDGCSRTIISQTVSTILGCVPIVGGFGSAAWNCLLAAGSAKGNYEHCLQVHELDQHSLSLQAPPVDLPVDNPADIPDNIFYEQAQLWADAASLYALVLDNTKWTVIDFTEWPRAKLIFETLQQSIHPGSAGGERVVQSERDAILQLSRPANITLADVLAMVDRFDRIMAGQLPPQNFNATAIGAAATKLGLTALELESRGWETTYDGFIRALVEMSQEEDAIIGGAVVGGGGSGGGRGGGGGGGASQSGLAARVQRAQGLRRKTVKLVEAPLYYRLTDMFSGFVRRGRLSNRGTLDNLIVAPDTLHSIEYFDPASMQKGRSFFISGPNGSSFRLPRFILLKAEPPDTDGDGLPDEAERIVGTDPSKIDTDGDGAGDGEELLNGLNPLDGVPQALGPVASAGVGGEAFNLAVQRNIAVVIGERVGVTFLDVSNPEQPVVVSRFEEATDLAAMALDWPRLVTGKATTSGGLTLVNVQDAARPTIVWRTNTSSSVKAIALGFGQAYVAEGRLRIYGLDSGEVVTEVAPNGYQSVRIAGDRLYAIRSSGNTFSLDVFRLEESGTRPVLEGSVDFTRRGAPEEISAPLLVADGYAYVGFFEGYQVVDVRDPTAPVVVGRSDQTQAAIHALNTDGSSLLGTVTSFAGPTSLQVSLYDASRPTVTTNFLAGFDTPGNPRKLSLYRGRMFIADESAGLTIANYRNAEMGTNPPSVSLVAFSSARNPPRHGSGTLLRLEANARDDVVVREVEFYLDSALVTTVGSYPFATDVRAPQYTPQKQNFTVQARAFDTARNSAWSAPLTIGLTPETRRPYLTSFTPASGTRCLTSAVVQVTAAFNETLATATLNAGWVLSWAGADGRTNTADDVLLPTTVSQSGLTNYVLEFAQPLPAGFYVVKATTNLTDVFGNRLETEVAWEFGLRTGPVTFIGSSNVWSQTATSRTNWSSGAIPTVNDFVDINLPGGRELRARQNVAAYRLIAHTPMAFEGLVSQGFSSELHLGEHAIFEKAVTINGQVTWAGGESDILDSLYIGGPNNSFLSDHILNNHGWITMDKSISTGLLLRNTAGQTVIRNLPGATWEHLGGQIAGEVFENHGLFIKRGTNSPRIDLQQFINLGTVEVREGTLQLVGGSFLTGHHQHLGAYRVDAGARLVFDTEFVDYGRATRIYGSGDVEFGESGVIRDEKVFPGTLEISGKVALLGGLRSIQFSGPINTSGPWQIARAVRLSGLNPHLTGPVTVESDGALIVATSAPLVLSSLVVSNDLTIDTALEVNGPLVLQGTVLSGFGRLRANGPVTFDGRLGGFRGETEVFGHFELDGPAECGDGAVVTIDAYDLSILPGGTLDLAGAKDLRFGPARIVNDGSILKTTSGVTRVLNSLHNRGLLRVTDGSLDFEQAGLLQTAGLTTLNTTGIVFRLRSGLTQGDRFVNLQGGRFEGNAVVTCGSVTNSAVVSPGLPIGTLDFQVGTSPVDSFYLQTATGTLQMDLAGPDPGVEHDQLKVSGRALLDGTLEITVADGYDPPLGHEFTILSANRVEGRFSTVRSSNLAGDKRFEVLYDNTTVRLRVLSP